MGAPRRPSAHTQQVAPLGAELPVTGRRLLIAVELYRRKHGRSPSWFEMRQALGLDWYEMTQVAWELRRNGLLYFSQSRAASGQRLRACVRRSGRGREAHRLDQGSPR
jgi:hypothetical protein